MRALGLAGLLFVARPAWAQSSDSATLAQALFTEGRALMEKNQIAEACAKFEESHRLFASSAALLNLGICHEKQGKLASASVELSQSLARAQSEKSADREAIAREHLAAIEPRISRLSVNVPKGSEVSGLEVKLDGVVLGRPAWGVAAGVDPGVHTVDATAPGYEPFHAQVDVKGEQQNLRTEIPPLMRLRPREITPPAAPPPPGDRDVGQGQRRVGLVIGGAGIIAAGVGAIFAIDASKKWSDAETACPNRRCINPSDTDLGKKAGTAADVATALFVLGGVALATGGVVFFTAPTAQPTSLRLAPTFDRAGLGLTLSGGL